MIVKGLEPENVKRIIDRVSRECFAENVITKRAPENYRGAVRFTLGLRDTRGPGHRRGFPHPWRTRQGGEYKPKRIAAACYHAYGEVIRGLLEGGAAYVQSAPIALERARCGSKPRRWTRETWYTHACEMAEVNIGSPMMPYLFADACDCGVGEMPDTPIKYPGSPDFFEKGQTANGRMVGLTLSGVPDWPIAEVE